MKTVYAVFKTAVYRHECGGIFTTLEAAEAAARSLIAGERDDYHHYEIVSFAVNKQTAQTPQPAKNCSGGGELQEADPVASLYRKDGHIVRAPE